MKEHHPFHCKVKPGFEYMSLTAYSVMPDVVCVFPLLVCSYAKILAEIMFQFHQWEREITQSQHNNIHINTIRWSMCCARLVCTRLHWLVLPYFSSIHDRGTVIRSSSKCTWCAAQTCPSSPRVKYPSGPRWSNQVWCRRAQTCSDRCYYMVRCMKYHLRQFFNTNLSNLFVFYLIGGLRCDRREIGASP